MKTSLSSFLYYYFPLEEAIRRTAEAGFDAIDVWGGRPHAYRKDLDGVEIAMLRAALDQYHLEVASFIPAQFRYPTSLCSPNETIRQDSVAYILDSIWTAAALGAPVVSVCPGHTLQGQTKAQAWALLEDSLIVIANSARKSGLRIAIEPADRYETDLMNTVAEAMQMVAELNYVEVGVLLDNGHVNLSEESLAEAIQVAGDRLFHVHIDDNLGQRDQHLMPGEGNCDLTDLVRLLRAQSYDGFLTAELSWDYILDPDPVARETAKRLKEWLCY